MGGIIITDWSLKGKWFKFIPEEIDDAGFIDTFEGVQCCGCDSPEFKEADIIYKNNIRDETYFPKKDIEILRQKLIEDVNKIVGFTGETDINELIRAINKRFGVEE